MNSQFISKKVRGNGGQIMCVAADWESRRNSPCRCSILTENLLCEVRLEPGWIKLSYGVLRGL